MANSEKFCLRWNDFERNISSAFRDIRDEKEFFDVTIACEDEQLQAHKVILSACSPFFRSVLRRNQPANQQGSLVLYLKGVTYRDMESVLNFMYHGEVNVAQDDLNSFLAVAEELRVKGLTQSTSGGSDASNTSTLPPKSTSLPSRRRPSEDSHQAPSSNAPPSYSSPSAPPIKRPRPPPPPAPRAPVAAQQAVEEDDEIQEYVPVKSEPAAQQQEMYEDPSQGAAAGGGMMMTTEDSMQYDESYGAYEEGYDEGAYYQEGGQETAGGAGWSDAVPCPYCSKTMTRKNLSRHITVKHTDLEPSQCCHCQKLFKSDWSLKEHERVQHGIFQSASRKQ